MRHHSSAKSHLPILDGEDTITPPWQASLVKLICFQSGRLGARPGGLPEHAGLTGSFAATGPDTIFCLRLYCVCQAQQKDCLLKLKRVVLCKRHKILDSASAAFAGSGSPRTTCPQAVLAGAV